MSTEWFPPDSGGVASHVEGLAKELDRRGHEVTIVTRNAYGRSSNREETHDGLDVVRTDPSPLALRAFMKRNHFDVIHAHHGFTSMPLLSLVVGRSLDLPSVLTTHTAAPVTESRLVWLPTGVAAFPLRMCLMCSDRIIAVSQAAADFIRFFSNGNRIEVIPNGVNHKRFTPGTGKRFGLGTDRVVLFVGRLVYRKGLHILISAVPKVLDVFPDTIFLVAGAGYARQWADFLVKRLGVQGNVRFLGHVPQALLPTLYASSTTFVLPSLFGESFGIVLLEAMSAGLPVVASRVGGVGEIVEDGVTGLLVEPGDIAGLAAALIEILSQPQRARSMGAEGRREVVSRFAWSVVAKEVEKVYEELA